MSAFFHQPALPPCFPAASVERIPARWPRSIRNRAFRAARACRAAEKDVACALPSVWRRGAWLPLRRTARLPDARWQARSAGTVDDRNGAFRTVQHALAAAVAAFPVYFDDISVFFHDGFLRGFLSVSPFLHRTEAQRRDQDHDFPFAVKKHMKKRTPRRKNETPLPARAGKGRGNSVFR